MAMRSLSTDYLVVGAGAMGMAFTDALIDHADAHVTLVDRRHAAGGHWQDAYPFVQLHQASQFYGVASTLLGTGAVQDDGPEAGLQQTSTAIGDPELLRRRAVSAAFSAPAESPSSAEASTALTDPPISSRPWCRARRCSVEVRRRVVDATYLSPTIPATSTTALWRR